MEFPGNAPYGSFRFVTLPLEILEKTSFFTPAPGNSEKLCATILKLEIPRSKIKTQGNFTSSFSLKPPEIPLPF